MYFWVIGTMTCLCYIKQLLATLFETPSVVEVILRSIYRCLGLIAMAGMFLWCQSLVEISIRRVYRRRVDLRAITRMFLRSSAPENISFIDFFVTLNPLIYSRLCNVAHLVGSNSRGMTHSLIIVRLNTYGESEKQSYRTGWPFCTTLIYSNFPRRFTVCTFRISSVYPPHYSTL